MKKKSYSDTIYLQPGADRGYKMLPREAASSDPDYVKHVICEGSYNHVLSYSTKGIHCSEPRCITNKPIED